MILQNGLILVAYILCAFSIGDNINSNPSSSQNVVSATNPLDDSNSLTAEKLQSTSSNSLETATLCYDFSLILHLPTENINMEPFIPFSFAEIQDKDIVQIYFDNNFSLSENMKEKLKACKVLWMHIENNEGNNIINIKNYISYCSPNTSLIFQWRYTANKDESADHPLSASQKLSIILKDTGIEYYASPFLLFVDPIEVFKENIKDTAQYYYKHLNLYYYLYSNILYRNYLSIYFLYTPCNSKLFSEFTEEEKKCFNMKYSSFLHSNIKYYGVVSMVPNFTISIENIFSYNSLDSSSSSLDSLASLDYSDDSSSSSDNPFLSSDNPFLDYFFNEQIYMVIKINSIYPFIFINPKKIYIPFGIWRNTFIKCSSFFTFPHLIITDIFLDDLILQRKRFMNICPIIENLDLYFIDRKSSFTNEDNNQNISNSFSFTNIARLFAFSASSFINAEKIYMHLPSSFSYFNDLINLILSSTSYSHDQISEFIKLEIEKDIFINSSVVRSEVIPNISDNYIVKYLDFKNLWSARDIDRNEFFSHSLNYLQNICNNLMKYGLFLSSPRTQTIILDNGEHTVTLISSNIVPPVFIFFNDSAQILCFKRFYFSTIVANEI